MIRILFADDDDILRCSITENIDWRGNGYDIVGVAKNGKEAYEIALRTCPQILLTDIRMPYMDGLELAQRVLESIDGCHIVFLTGFDELEYVKEALRLRADDYIMKGEPGEKILQAVNLIRCRVEQEIKNAHLTVLGEKVSRQNLLAGLLREDCSMNELEKIQGLLKMNPQKYVYRVAAIQNFPEKQSNGSIVHSAEIQRDHWMEESIEKYLAHQGKIAYMIRYQQYMILFLELNSEQEEEATSQLQGLLSRVYAKGNITFQIGVSRVWQESENFSLYLDEAIVAAMSTEDKDVQIHFFKELSQTRFVRLIREYIGAHYNNPDLSLNLLSEELFLAPAYISSLFKRYTNTNLKNYLIQVRLKAACQLLETTDLCVYEIAEAVGYTNSQYFSVIFKKYIGTAPLEYRAGHQMHQQ